jgi:hypothetical protein
MSATDLLLPELHASVDALVQRTVEFDTRRTPRALAITSRDLDILQALAELRYLTTSMIAVLAWGSYNTRLRSRLPALFDAGFVRRFRPRLVNGAGVAQWVYELDTAGHRLLTAERPTACPMWTRSDLAAFSYAEHDLELNAMLCELAARAASRRGHGGPLLRAAPFTILGARTGRVDPAAEARPLDADPANELPVGDVVRSGDSYEALLEPDATLVGRHSATGAPIAVLLEYDRTRRATKLTSKLARYDAFLSDGWRRTRHACCRHEPAVLFVIRDEKHLEAAIREADRQLTAWVGPSAARPEQGRYPGRDEIGFTTRERLMTTDSVVLQVPPHPPGQTRQARTPVPTIETALSLSSLFAPPDRGGSGPPTS